MKSANLAKKKIQNGYKPVFFPHISTYLVSAKLIFSDTPSSIDSLTIS